MAKPVTAQDGQLARVVKPWSHEKLHYVDRYLDIFCTSMKRSWSSLVYADLLAGPGKCVEVVTREESLGSPLLAVRRSEFRRLFLNDASTDVAAALQARTGDQSSDRVHVSTLDCNVAVDDARGFLFRSGEESRTLGLAVIDPTAFQMRFESIARLTTGVRFDLIVIFMSGYIRRFISVPEYRRALDGFFGTDDWQKLVDQKNAGRKVTYRKLLDLYEKQLNSIGYLYVDDLLHMRNTRKSTIYHIVFASKHERGKEFFEKIRQQSYSGQRRLNLE